MPWRFSFLPGRSKKNYAALYPVITDYPGIKGPLAGIAAAMAAYPDTGWLVVACDLPLLDYATLAVLVANRDFDAMATSFESPHDGLPEPLIAIWEPTAASIISDFVTQGIKCPRKVLLNGYTKILKPPVPSALMNVNTPEDAAVASEQLKRGSSGSGGQI